MEKSESYQVNLEAFQGPMDLLLFLIRKKKLDIHDIPIAAITSEYLKYLEASDRINLEREAEFLVIAALLIYIKSQMLLPRESLDGDEDDPRRILVDRLLDYQKVKAACRLLRDKEEDSLKRWPRSVPPPCPEDEEPVLTEVSLFDLAEAFFLLMKRLEGEEIRIISAKEFSLKDKMNEILEILKKDSYLDFMEYFQNQGSVDEALGSFFCLLELIKRKIVIAVQESLFEPIKVWLRKENPV